MIKTQIIGNVGADATINTVNSKQVINFNICHTEKFRDANGVENNRSLWVNCSYWSDKTAIAAYIKKGTQLYVEGQPSVDTYTKDGKTFAQLRCRVSQIQLCGGSQPSSNPQSTITHPPQQSNESNSAFDKMMDDSKDGLPF